MDYTPWTEKRVPFQRYPYDPAHPGKLSRAPFNKNTAYDHITFVTQDALGAIWIGSFGGLTRYDENTKTVRHYINKDSVSGFTGISENPFAHYISRDGILWIGCLDGNVFTINPNSINIPSSKPGAAVLAFYSGNDSALYLGTSNGLFKKNLKNGTIKNYGIKSSVIHLDKDNKGNLWFTTFGDGAYKLQLSSETLTQYKHSATTENSLSNDSGYVAYVDRAQNIWIGTRNGLDKLDPVTGSFQHFRNDPNNSSSINSSTIFCLLEDQNGDIWVGHSNGALDKLDPKTGKCRNFPNLTQTFSIFQTRDGNIWAGDYAGLFKYVEKADDFLSIPNPLTGNSFVVVYSMAEDDLGNLWFGIPTGIARFNPASQQIAVFGKNAGIDPIALTSFAAYKDGSGRMYFGETSGYYSLYPKDIERKSNGPQITFSGFSLGSEQIKPGPQSPLSEEISKASAINLVYNQNIFSIDYIPIDYNDPSANQSLYKLENYDNDWRIASNPGKAYYFNVPPGKYIFHVRASNSLGKWSEKSIAVTITPPWWHTWWAYILFTLLFVSVIWGFIGYRSRMLRKENRILEEKVAHRTEQLNRSLQDPEIYSNPINTGRKKWLRLESLQQVSHTKFKTP